MKITKRSPDVALLLLRVTAGLLLGLGHGWMKYNVLLTNPKLFPDPLGIGPLPSLIASFGAECGCSLMVALGFYTRLFCLPILFTMLVVAGIVHQNDTWLQTEPSVLYLVIYSFIAWVGPGRLSIDGSQKMLP